MNNMKRMATNIWWTHGRTIRSQMMFWFGIGFLVNWIYNVSTGNAEDSWMFAILFVTWGWDGRPKFLTKEWMKKYWAIIRYRHVVTIESTEEEFYKPILEWIMEHVGKDKVWLNLEQQQTVITNVVTGKAVSCSLDSRTFEFRFKKKKDAAHFRLVWG